MFSRLPRDPTKRFPSLRRPVHPASKQAQVERSEAELICKVPISDQAGIMFDWFAEGLLDMHFRFVSNDLQLETATHVHRQLHSGIQASAYGTSIEYKVLNTLRS